MTSNRTVEKGRERDRSQDLKQERLAEEACLLGGLRRGLCASASPSGRASCGFSERQRSTGPPQTAPAGDRPLPPSLSLFTPSKELEKGRPSRGPGRALRLELAWEMPSSSGGRTASAVTPSQR